MKIEGLTQRRDIEAFIDYTCAVIAKKRTDNIMIVEDSEQMTAIKEIFGDDKNVKIDKNEKDGTIEITGSREALQKIAKVIAEDVFEETFLDTPLFLAVAV